MINLLPWRLERKRKIRLRLLFFCCTAVLIVNLFGIGVYILLAHKIEGIEVRYKKNNAQLVSFVKHHAGYFNFAKQQKMRRRSLVLLENIKQRQLVLVRLLHDLLLGMQERVIPVALMMRDKQVVVQVIAPLHFSFAAYMNRLRQREYINNVVINKTSRTTKYQEFLLVITL